MKNVRIELNAAGGRALLNGPEVRELMRQKADAIAAAAGPGMEAETWQGHDRVRANVKTATADAKRREAEDRALSRALEAGR